MEGDSDCNWFSVETYRRHRTAGELSVCLFVRVRMFYFTYDRSSNLLNCLWLTTFYSWARKQWGGLLVFFQLIKMHRCSHPNKKFNSTKGTRNRNCETVVCGRLIRKEWRRRCVVLDKKRQVKWKMAGEHILLTTLTSIISLQCISAIWCHFSCNGRYLCTLTIC